MTFKEFMRRPNAELDNLVDRTERERENNEDAKYDNYISSKEANANGNHV